MVRDSDVPICTWHLVLVYKVMSATMSKVVVRCRLHHGEADEEKPCRVHLHAQLDGGRLHAMAVRQVGLLLRSSKTAARSAPA